MEINQTIASVWSVTLEEQIEGYDTYTKDKSYVFFTIYDKSTWQPIGAYKKAGFKEFGRRREVKWLNIKLWDAVYTECLSTEFQSKWLAGVFGDGLDEG